MLVCYTCTNKDTDKPVHLHSAFVVCLGLARASDTLLYKTSSRKTGKPVPLHNIIGTFAVLSRKNITHLLSTFKFSILQPVPVAENADLCLTLRL